MAHLFGETAVSMMDNSKLITSKDSDIIFGQMEDNIKEYGKITK